MSRLVRNYLQRLQRHARGNKEGALARWRKSTGPCALDCPNTLTVTLNRDLGILLKIFNGDAKVDENANGAGVFSFPLRKYKKSSIVGSGCADPCGGGFGSGSGSVGYSLCGDSWCTKSVLFSDAVFDPTGVSLGYYCFPPACLCGGSPDPHPGDTSSFVASDVVYYSMTLGKECTCGKWALQFDLTAIHTTGAYDTNPDDPANCSYFGYTQVWETSEESVCLPNDLTKWKTKNWALGWTFNGLTYANYVGNGTTYTGSGPATLPSDTGSPPQSGSNDRGGSIGSGGLLLPFVLTGLSCTGTDDKTTYCCGAADGGSTGCPCTGCDDTLSGTFGGGTIYGDTGYGLFKESVIGEGCGYASDFDPGGINITLSCANGVWTATITDLDGEDDATIDVLNTITGDCPNGTYNITVTSPEGPQSGTFTVGPA